MSATQISRIRVVTNDSGMFALVLDIDDSFAGYVHFQTRFEYSKKQADFRAVMLATHLGAECDSLPTEKI